MGQKQRDRLKVLHEVIQGKLKQVEAAEQLKLTTRQVRRLVNKMDAVGDRAVLHGLMGRQSNRRTNDDLVKRCVAELKKPECHDFGPTFAAEHLHKAIEVNVGRDTVRKWMVEAGLWRVVPRKVKTVHVWRPRRSCCGELVQWDTSFHAWLEDRGSWLYLIAMIDDATSRLYGRFVEHDSAEENMRTLQGYLERYGRPLDFYTDKAGMFEVARKRGDAEGEPMAPTQITRALTELGIGRISAHSPQAKGRVERCFGTLQDRLVKHLRLAGVCNLDGANAVLQNFLAEWNQNFTTPAANPTDAHRPLGNDHDLSASLSFVKHPTVENNYTFSFRGKRYQIAKAHVHAGMRGERIRAEQRLDGKVAARFQGRYLDIRRCENPAPAGSESDPLGPTRKDHNRGGRSSWMRTFSISKRKNLARD